MAHKNNKWVQHFILLTAPLLTVIDVFIVNVAIPAIKAGIHASDGEVELVIAAYLLGYASFQITGARAGDYFGRKKVFQVGMVLFVLASAVCGLAVNAEMLIVARLFQGVSGAFMTPQALSYVQVLFPDPRERTKAIGFVGITLGIAAMTGQFLGGYFSDLHTFTDGWRFIFFINLPVGAAALWAAARFLNETGINRSGRFDYSGVVLLTLALGSLIYPLTMGREQGWPWWSFTLIGLSLVLFGVFFRSQLVRLRSGGNPLIDLRLFGNRPFNLGLLLVTFYFMMHTANLLISTLFLQNGLHISAYRTGLYFVWSGALFMLASFLSIRLVNTYGKLPLQVGTVLMMVTYGLQVLLFRGQVSPLTITVLVSLVGLAGGLVLPSLINATLRWVPPVYAGAASGVYNTVQQAASSLGICLIGGLFFSVLHKGQDTTKAFHYGLCAQLACLALVFLLLALLPRLHGPKRMG